MSILNRVMRGDSWSCLVSCMAVPDCSDPTRPMTMSFQQLPRAIWMSEQTTITTPFYHIPTSNGTFYLAESASQAPNTDSLFLLMYKAQLTTFMSGLSLWPMTPSLGLSIFKLCLAYLNANLRAQPEIDQNDRARITISDVTMSIIIIVIDSWVHGSSPWVWPWVVPVDQNVKTKKHDDRKFT